MTIDFGFTGAVMPTPEQAQRFKEQEEAEDREFETVKAMKKVSEMPDSSDDDELLLSKEWEGDYEGVGLKIYDAKYIAGHPFALVIFDGYHCSCDDELSWDDGMAYSVKALEKLWPKWEEDCETDKAEFVKEWLDNRKLI